MRPGSEMTAGKTNHSKKLVLIEWLTLVILHKCLLLSKWAGVGTLNVLQLVKLDMPNSLLHHMAKLFL